MAPVVRVCTPTILVLDLCPHKKPLQPRIICHLLSCYYGQLSWSFVNIKHIDVASVAGSSGDAPLVSSVLLVSPAGRAEHTHLHTTPSHIALSFHAALTTICPHQPLLLETTTALVLVVVVVRS